MAYAFRSMLILSGMAALVACSPKSPDTNTTSETTTTQTGVTREEVAPPEPTPAAMPAQAVLQTQPGPKGAQVMLNKVAVTGDVLTVQLSYVLPTADPWESEYYDLNQVSIIDDATAQRIGVLKDNSGQWLASPLQSDGKQIRVEMKKTPTIVWFKFPAPPATSRTVSLNIPDVAPFDGVPVTR